MRWQQTEYVLKGIFLGLLLFVALQTPETQTDAWLQLAAVGVCTFSGFILFLGIAAIRKVREGYRIKGRRFAFFLFLLLENPALVYGGVLLGLITGALLRIDTEGNWEMAAQGRWEMAACVGGGAVLGLVFWVLRILQQPKTRLWVGLGLAAVLAIGGVALIYYRPDLLSPNQQQMFGYLLLLGIPVFYLLTFASLVEESEVEIAAICGAMGVGAWILTSESSYTVRNLLIALSLVIYYVYTRNILPGLRVFKHTIRGLSYAGVGRYRWALISLGRALELDPKNKLAQEELWRVHREMDFNKIAEDKETLALVNFDLCLDRVSSLLVNPPTMDQLDEADHLLNIINTHKPELKPGCDYWRAVAFIHQKKYDEAASYLEQVLAETEDRKALPYRQAILLDAWRLAMTHPEMKKRVGKPQLENSARRMEAIAAVEQYLAENPKDTATWDLKRELYEEVSEPDYNEGIEPGATVHYFDHHYAKEQGLAMITDETRWQRGAELLRMAARGVPESGPTLFVEIARACEKAGDIDGAWENYELAKEAGAKAGPENLTEKDRAIYFQVVKMLADTAREEGNIDKAIENYQLYTKSGKAGVETYRALAALFEKKEDVWSALHSTEHGLSYEPSDRDLLERKDKYYYSVTPQDVRDRWEKIQKWFDGDYCVRKARWVLDRHSGDMDLLDWGNHLLELALVAKPSSITMRMLRGRIQRIKGDFAKAMELFEEVRTNKPEKFGSKEDEESWYLACKALGDLYLNDQPAKALECLNEFKNYPKSGADTLYKIGVALEAMGDLPRAAKFYEQVVAYESHPRYHDARDGLQRVKAGASR